MMERISCGGAVQLVLDTRDGQVAREVRAVFHRCMGGLVRPAAGRALRVFVTEDGEVPPDTGADAVLHLSAGCKRQVFPRDPGREPIRLRLPLSVLSLRVALDYAAHKVGRPGREAARS